MTASTDEDPADVNAAGGAKRVEAEATAQPVRPLSKEELEAMLSAPLGSEHILSRVPPDLAQVILRNEQALSPAPQADQIKKQAP